MSGNPFRRVRGKRIPESYDDEDGEDVAPPASNAFASTTKRKKKVVTIQTPPQSPEDPPRRLSTGRISPPPPPRTPEDDADESDSTATADSELEQAMRNTRRNSGSLAPPTALGLGAPVAPVGGAPYNPFARTLATSEAAFGLQRDTDGQQEGGNGGHRSTNASGRPAMDVDQFKNILLTGSAAPSPPASTPAVSTAQAPRLQDSSSNTDASSASRQSLFDPYLEIHQETPRTSFDAMDAPSDSSDGDDEESSGLMTSSERLDDFAPPAPPKHTPGRPWAPKGPQTVSFADFDESIPDPTRVGGSLAPVPTGGKLRPPMLKRSPSDLNKPLPPPPVSPKVVDPTQIDLTRPTPQDGGGTIASMDDGTDAKKTPPPPPPTSRRGGAASTGQGRVRSASDATQNSVYEEPGTIVSRADDTTSKSTPPPPPPPPSRKTKPSPQSDSPAAASPSPASNVTESKAMAPPPGPPPRRMASKAGNSVNRASSNASRSSAQRKEGSGASTSAPAPAPPAPPPRRGAGGSRQSMEVARAVSGEDGRRRSSGMSEESTAVVGDPVSESSTSTDILADMTAFQREIDALRARAEGAG